MNNRRQSVGEIYDGDVFHSYMWDPLALDALKAEALMTCLFSGR